MRRNHFAKENHYLFNAGGSSFRPRHARAGRDPEYANVTVRAVSSYNINHNIVEPVVYAMVIGEEATFNAPTVPFDWILEGASTQTHVVERDLEVIFKYWPYSPPPPPSVPVH